MITRKCLLLMLVGTSMLVGEGWTSLPDIKSLEAKCKTKDYDACVELGNIYRAGEGVKPDSFQAVDYYRLACENRNGDACWRLGQMYLIGFGVRESQSTALELYGLACDYRSSEGCHAYAKLHED